jgi:nitronate monooxygenase
VEVAEAKAIGGPVAINIMVALDSTYEASVLGALDGGVDAIVSGAGLPLRLPVLVQKHERASEVALIPIVSSGRALRLLCLRWQKAGRLPDAAVVEGPLAGGHLGWKTAADAQDPAHTLENLLAEVLAVAGEFGDFPVIAAGGIYTHNDIRRMLDLGAAGVQMGTRFLATFESGASEAYKRAVVESTEADIHIAEEPGSPCGLPFRVLVSSPMYRETSAGRRKARCDKGYVLGRGPCLALAGPARYFCICNGLLSSAGYNPDEELPLYTVGANASRVDRLLSVADLMAELRCERWAEGDVRSSCPRVAAA